MFFFSSVCKCTLNHCKTNLPMSTIKVTLDLQRPMVTLEELQRSKEIFGRRCCDVIRQKCKNLAYMLNAVQVEKKHTAHTTRDTIHTMNHGDHQAVGMHLFSMDRKADQS
ncbi:hypothetical protein ILYODFUR_008621 [Ilyodon furcidens]|uniref:Uncharacterized protein n=1 Tax=Ilyodon furcidens TaxID=33524 RepID=A0ABV0VF21_9TELE